MSFDSYRDFLLTVRDIIHRHGGIIYGGFNRDMVLLDQQLKEGVDKRTYPIDIDLVIECKKYIKMIDELKEERGYTIETLNLGEEHKYDFGTDLYTKMCKIIKHIKVTGGGNTITLDVNILINLNDAKIDDQRMDEMLTRFFSGFRLEFNVNRIATRELNGKKFTMYINKYGELIEDDTKLKSLKAHIRKKIAVCMDSINIIREKRVEKMFSKGFKIISEDLKVQWIERPPDEEIECLVCGDKLTSRWVPVQNILNYSDKCKCKKVYICIDDKYASDARLYERGCIYKLNKNACLICHAKNDLE